MSEITQDLRVAMDGGGTPMSAEYLLTPIDDDDPREEAEPVEQEVEA